MFGRIIGVLVALLVLTLIAGIVSNLPAVLSVVFQPALIMWIFMVIAGVSWAVHESRREAERKAAWEAEDRADRAQMQFYQRRDSDLSAPPEQKEIPVKGSPFALFLSYLATIAGTATWFTWVYRDLTPGGAEKTLIWIIVGSGVPLALTCVLATWLKNVLWSGYISPPEIDTDVDTEETFEPFST